VLQQLFQGFVWRRWIVQRRQKGLAVSIGKDQRFFFGEVEPTVRSGMRIFS
jgi:hypothetical protein